MDQPDAVVSQLPYMTPPPAPPGMKWVVPPRTKKWLDDLCREKTGQEMIWSNDGEPRWSPVISADHRAQLINVSSRGDRAEYRCFIWSGSVNIDANKCAVSRTVAGQQEAGRVREASAVEIPQDVRRELVAMGYSHPPIQVVWLTVDFSAGRSSGGQTITIDCANPPEPFHSSIWLGEGRSTTIPAAQ